MITQDPSYIEACKKLGLDPDSAQDTGYRNNEIWTEYLKYSKELRWFYGESRPYEDVNYYYHPKTKEVFITHISIGD